MFRRRDVVLGEQGDGALSVQGPVRISQFIALKIIVCWPALPQGHLQYDNQFIFCLKNEKFHVPYEHFKVVVNKYEVVSTHWFFSVVPSLLLALMNFTS